MRIETGLIQTYTPRGSAESSQTTSKLVSLPAELLTEVFKLLTWEDMLHLRVTCKFLATVTRTRAIWTHLVAEYIYSKPQPLVLERPTDMYTSGELEHLLLLWNSAEAGWQRNDGHPARERVFATDDLPELAHIVKGGRWLLITTGTGAVTYYDLDSDTIVGAQLIPAQMAPNRITKVLMAIDTHRESAMLSFTMALSLSDRTQCPGAEYIPYEIVQIWCVTLVLNESQKAIGLNAEQLACFPHKRMARAIMALSLLGSTIAFSALVLDDIVPICTFVVDWVHAHANPSTYSWRVLNGVYNTSRIHLLPCNNLLIVHVGIICLLNYSTAQPTTSTALRGQNNPFLKYVWQTDVDDLFPHALSTCFLSADSTRLTFVADGFLHSMIIENTPRPSASVPSIVTLMGVPFHFTGIGPFPALGYNRGIFFDHHHNAWLMRYTFPGADDTFEPTLIHKCITSMFPSSALQRYVMDENSGRVLIPDKSQVILLDFALVFQ